MKIFGDIFKKNKICTIAEIGLNHNGCIDTALKMIEKASESGADAVKFQTFNAENFYSKYTKSLLSSGTEDIPDNSLNNFFKELSLNADEHKLIKRRADELGLVFISSPFDLESLELLEKINVDIYKIASSEVTNHLLIEAIAKTKKPVILSTGMSKESEIEEAVEILTKYSIDFVLLHCVSLYPTEYTKINLGRMLKLSEKFRVKVGFSDHSVDSEAAVIAVHMGASIIEKHFKLSEDFECPDKNVSLDPEAFKNMVKEINKFRDIKGSGDITPIEEELNIAKSARKSIFARKKIPVNKVLDENDLILKRPGVGISATEYNNLIGKKCIHAIEQDCLIKSNSIK